MAREFNNFPIIEDLIKKNHQKIIEISSNLENLLLYLTNENFPPLLQSEIIAYYHREKRKDLNLFSYLLQIKYESSIQYIKIFIKQICGKTISLVIDKNNSIENLYPLTYEKRDEQQKLATYENYLKSVSLTHRGDKIYNSTFITENLRSWTHAFGINYNLKTLSGICPISLSEIKVPFFLNPGCAHCFEKQELVKFIKNNNKNCPTCSMNIDSTLLDKLNF